MKKLRIILSFLFLLPFLSWAETTVDGGKVETYKRITVTESVTSPAHNISDKKVTVTTFTSAGINAAIDELGSESGEVYCPEGDYDNTGEVTIDYDNTKLRGAGNGTRFLATNRFVYTTVTGTPADGETLTGDTTGYTATVVKVDTTNKIVWYHTLSDATNFDTDEVISWSGGADTTINGSAPTEQNFNVISLNKNYCTISDLYIVGGSGGGNSANGIDIANGNYNMIENCVIEKSDNSGIKIGNTSQRNKIINNRINTSDEHGIFTYLVNVSYTEIKDNVISGTKGTGIKDDRCLYSMITGNTLIECDYSIDTSSNYSTIRNNWIIGTAHYHGSGIRVSTNSYLSITNNYIYDSEGYGIEVLSDKHNISDNYCIGNDMGSILVTTDNNSIVGNYCYGENTSDRGIWLDEADYCTVTDNYTANHNVVGIQEDSDCQNNLIYGNNCQDTTPYALSGTARERFRVSGGQPQCTSKFTVTFSDLTDADTSQDITLFTVPAGGRIVDVYAYVTTAFTGGSVSACTMAVGDTDPDGLSEEHDVLGTGNGVWILEGQNGTDKGDYLYDDTVFMRAKIYTSATAIKAQFVSTTDNLVNLAAGSIDIYVLYSVAE